MNSPTRKLTIRGFEKRLCCGMCSGDDIVAIVACERVGPGLDSPPEGTAMNGDLDCRIDRDATIDKERVALHGKSPMSSSLSTQTVGSAVVDSVSMGETIHLPEPRTPRAQYHTLIIHVRQRIDRPSNFQEDDTVRSQMWNSDPSESLLILQDSTYG